MATEALETIGFGGASLPPGYAVIRHDDHTAWVRLCGPTDYDREGALHWSRWASFRGAWADYHLQMGAGNG